MYGQQASISPALGLAELRPLLGDTARLGGLHARLCDAFLVLVIRPTFYYRLQYSALCRAFSAIVMLAKINGRDLNKAIGHG